MKRMLIQDYGKHIERLEQGYQVLETLEWKHCRNDSGPAAAATLSTLVNVALHKTEVCPTTNYMYQST